MSQRRDEASQAAPPPGKQAHSLISREAFLTRQPVFTVTRDLHAYSLLDRPIGIGGAEVDRSETVRTRMLQLAIQVIGIDVLSGGSRLIVPLCSDSIEDGLHSLLDPDRTVLHLMDTECSSLDRVRSACDAARRAGYRTALSAGKQEADMVEFLDACDVLYVYRPDFDTPGCERHCEAAKAIGKSVWIAGIQSHEQARWAESIGCDLLQGTFYQQPEIVSGTALTSLQVNRLRMLAELNRPALDMACIEEILRSDIHLPCALLRHLNTSSYGLSHRVSSIQHALVLLGEQKLRFWGSLATVGLLAEHKPSQLMVASLVRAHFCEQAGSSQRYDGPPIDLYMLGLLSLVDALLDHPMPAVLESLPVSVSVRDALSGDRSSPIRRYLDLAIACEQGAWSSVDRICLQLGMNHRQAASLYYASLNRVNQLGLRNGPDTYNQGVA